MTLADLTPRQREIALLVGRGLAYGVIARSLSNLRRFSDGARVSPRTVRIHVHTIARLLPASVEGSTPYRRVMRWVLDEERAA